MKTKEIKETLEQIRQSIRDENVSYGELADLWSLESYIDEDDIELLQWIRTEE